MQEEDWRHNPDCPEPAASTTVAAPASAILLAAVAAVDVLLCSERSRVDHPVERMDQR